MKVYLNSIVFVSRIQKLIFMLVFTGLFFASCSKEKEVNTASDETGNVIFSMGAVDDNVIDNPVIKAAANTTTKTSGSSKTIKLENGVMATASTLEGTYSGIGSPTITKATSTRAASGAVAAKVTPGVNYRILIYDNNGTFVKSVLAVSGTDTPIVLPVGKQLVWYAYSYNDDNAVAEPADLNNPSIVTPNDKDLLYASGSFTSSKSVTRIPITFAHKLARIDVQVNSDQLSATITQIAGTIANTTGINAGTLNLRTGSISNIVNSTVGNLTWTNADGSTTPSNQKYASYYTADPTALTSIQLKLTQLDVRYVNNSNETLVTPASPRTVSFGTYAPAVGKILLTDLNLWKIIPVKKILHLSTTSVYGYSAENASSANVIGDARNFGTNATSIVKSAGFTHVGPQLTSAQTVAEITAKPDIIIIGYAYTPNNAELEALKTYLNAKGVIICHMESPSGLQTTLRSFLNNPAITVSSRNSSGSVYQLNSVSDEILNGPFGNLTSGKFWGEDASATGVISGLNLTDITVYSGGSAFNESSSYPGTVSMFKHNTLNLFVVGDGGFLSNHNTVGNSTSNTIEPFAVNGSNFPISRAYGRASTSSSPSGNLPGGSWQVSNSIVFSNVMAWAIKRAQFYGINTTP